MADLLDTVSHRHLASEIQATKTMLEASGARAMVVGLATDGQTVIHAEVIGTEISRAEGLAFLQGLSCALTWLNAYVSALPE